MTAESFDIEQCIINPGDLLKGLMTLNVEFPAVPGKFCSIYLEI